MCTGQVTGRGICAGDGKREGARPFLPWGRFPQGRDTPRGPLELMDCEHQMTVLARACYTTAQTDWTARRTDVRGKCQIRHFGLLTPQRGRPYNPPIAEDRGGGNDAKD